MIAHLESGGIGTERFDGAGAFHAQHRGQRNLVQSGALIGIDKIHAGGGELHQHLAGRGLGLGKIGVAQGAGVAGLFDENGFHDMRILRLVCTMAAKSSR